MTTDPFADRVAQVRQRFVSTLPTKIDETWAALPQLGGAEAASIEAVANVYRCMHGIVGIGRIVGFPEIGNAAREAEDILRASYRAGRALNAGEIPLLEKSLHALREIAARELQSFHALSS